MRLLTYEADSGEGIGWREPTGVCRGLPIQALGLDLAGVLCGGPARLAWLSARLETAPELDPARITLRPPIPRPGKIICIGLNYLDHSTESGFEPPSDPAVFARYASSLVAHEAPLIRPQASNQFDFEGELAVVIGRGGRHVPRAQALEHVGGYAAFNDSSVRDFQMKSTQWTLGKTFDGTGAFGPDLVTPDELPPGATGLRLETRLNGQVVQSASTSDFIFDVARLIEILSQVMTLSPGDVIATGTPAGIGAVRKPPLWMRPGDVCEVEIEGVGRLRNPVAQETLT